MSNQKARELRKNMTDAEKVPWRHLHLQQVAGNKFRRQCPIGKYIVDFVCLERKIVVGIDGGQHAEQIQYEEKLTSLLISKGYTVLRFWDNEVLRETDGVLEVMFEALTPHLDPPPRGGGKTETRRT